MALFRVMHRHQSLGNPRKDALLRALKRHPDQCDLPRIDMGPYQESLTAIGSDRERTYYYDKERVQVDQINSKANNQGKKEYISVLNFLLTYRGGMLGRIGRNILLSALRRQE